MKLALAITCALMLPALAASAQQRPAFQGVVTGLGGVPLIADATIEITAAGLTVTTDSGGVFTLPHLPAGTYELIVRASGWLPALHRLQLPHAERIRIELTPDPVLLDSIVVAVDMLRQRRIASPHRVTSFGRSELAAAGNFMVEALRANGVSIAECTTRERRWCVYRRGVVSPAVVCIDDRPALSGLDELARYPAEALHSVEVYAAGQMIRAYTGQYMEWVRREAVRLVPIDMSLRRC